MTIKESREFLGRLLHLFVCGGICIPLKWKQLRFVSLGEAATAFTTVSMALKEKKLIESTCTFLDFRKTKSAFVDDFRVLISEKDLRNMLFHMITMDDLTIAMQVDEFSEEFQEILQVDNIRRAPVIK